MGRSGGGGSGHSSGGFGGGHSSGGFSGGGRSSGGGSSGGFSSGHHGGYGGYHHHHYHSYYGPSWYGGYYGPRGPRGGSGGNLIAIVLLFFVIMIMLVSFSNLYTENSVQKSTKDREALSGVVNKTDWYKDDIGWIRNKSVLIEGLEDFYNATGVQPYVLFVPYSSAYWNNDTIKATVADAYLEQVYKQKFSDEGHFIFAYFQCQNDSSTELDGEFRYLSGYSADAIMDNEAISIFWGYFEQNYYNTSLSTEKMISKTFSQTAKSIMSKATNGWDVMKTVGIVIGVIIILMIIYNMFKKKAQREKEKEEYTKEILDKPLETFGEDTKDLEDKYK